MVKSQAQHELQNTIQLNCHIADSAHAADYTLCIYLLKMREYYRWEMKQDFSTSLDNKEVGRWLRERESYWEEIEEQPFRPIQWQGETYDPFDSESLNVRLREQGLLYSSGLGLNNRPHFFLARLNRYEQHHGYELHIADEELARDLPAPPAMSQGKHIFIRRESLKRLMWERLETWRWNRPDNALGRAFACYDCDNDLDQSLDAMTDKELENVVMHEIGEIEAGQQLGDGWKELVFSMGHSRAGLMLRAIRDYLADSLRTLPNLLEKEDEASLQFFFGNLSNMRKDLAPQLMQAYLGWHELQDISPLSQWVEQAQSHWADLSQQCLSLYAQQGAEASDSIIDLIESQRL